MTRQRPTPRRFAAAARRPRRYALTAGAALLALVLSLPGVAAAGLSDLLAAAPDWRHAGKQPLEPQNLVRPSGGVTLEQAANMVRRQTGGRVLSASPSERSGERGFDVRVLLDGKRVKSYFVSDQGRIRSGD